MSAATLWDALDRIGFDVVRALLSVLWQSSILLAAVGGLAYALRKRRASVRHALWVVALLVAPAVPILGWAALRLGTPRAEIPVMPAYSAPAIASSPLPVFPVEDEPTALPAPVSPLPQPADEAVAKPVAFSLAHYPWALALLAYASGLALFLALVAIGRLRIRSWTHSGALVTDRRVLEIFERARGQLGLSRDFVVVESDAVAAPMTIRTLHPVVLLPAGLAKGVSDADLHAVAVHELAHVKRADTFVLSLASLVRAALFFHPLVWIACRQLSLLAEQAADDAVLDVTGEATPYARMLARMARRLRRRELATELAVGIVISKSALLHRVEAILSDRRDRIRKLSRWALVGTLAGIAISLLLAAGLPLGQKATTQGEAVVAEKEQDKLIARLPNGVTVELVGVSEHPSEGKEWWRPTGMPFEEPPYAGTEEVRLPGARQQLHEFAFKLRGVGDGDCVWRPPTHLEGAAVPVSVHDREGKAVADLRAGIAEVDTAAFPAVDVRIGILTGKWKTIYSSSHKEEYAAAFADDGPVVNFMGQMPPYDRDRPGPTRGQVAHSFPLQNQAVRVVAVDTSGEQHQALSFRFSPAINKTQSGIYWFEPPRKEIDELLFQTRPCTWVTFKDVSLRPGRMEEERLSSTDTIERFVHDDGEERDQLIDLDTAKLFSFPDDFASRDAAAQLEWFRANGIDAGGETNESARGLACVNLTAAPVSSDLWDAPPAVVIDKIIGPPRAVMSAKDGTPATFAFKTREGGVGILQILEISDTPPRGVRIRYRMLRRVAKTDAPARGEREEHAPRIPAVWVTLLALSTVKSLGDCTFAYRARELSADKVKIRSVELEIRTMDLTGCIARVPDVIDLPRSMSGTVGFSRRQVRLIGEVPAGEYMAAVNVNGVRCSNVTRLKIDSHYDPKQQPMLRLVPLPLGPGQKLPYLGLIGTGIHPRYCITFLSLLVDGVIRSTGAPKNFFNGGLPIESWSHHWVDIIDLSSYKPQIEPKAQYTVKATVMKRESAVVTIPADGTLGLDWDKATAGIKPPPGANLVPPWDGHWTGRQAGRSLRASGGPVDQRIPRRLEPGFRGTL